MKMRYKYLIVLLFLLMSCASKKESTKVVYKDREVIKTEYVSLPIQTDYAFELECDSVGNVKPVSFLKSSGVNQANFNINDNELSIRLLTGESRDTSVKENIKSDVEITEDILRYRTPFWIYPTFISLILIIIGLGYLASSQILGFLTKFKFW